MARKGLILSGEESNFLDGTRLALKMAINGEKGDRET